MNEEQAIELISSILSAQKLTIQEHQKVQEAFGILLNKRKRSKRQSPEIQNGDNDVQLQGTDG